MSFKQVCAKNKPRLYLNIKTQKRTQEHCGCSFAAREVEERQRLESLHESAKEESDYNRYEGAKPPGVISRYPLPFIPNICTAEILVHGNHTLSEM